MSVWNTHIIRRAIFDLQLNEQKGSFDVQQRASSMFHDLMQSEIEGMLNKFDIPGRVISIDKLQVNLGRLDIGNYEDSLRAFQKSLGLELARYFNQNPDVFKDPADDMSNQFLHFLKHGSLKWNCRFQSPEDLLLEILRNWNDRIQERIWDALTHSSRKYRLSQQISMRINLNLILKLLNLNKWNDDDLRFWESQLDRSALFNLYHDLNKLKGIAEPQDLTNHIKSLRKPNSSSKPKPNQDDQDDDDLDGSDFITVSGAGIVLLNPFLRHLFEYNGLIDKDDFISEEHRIKGIFLLNYLVNGEEHLMEHHAALFKLLCGFNLKSPTPFSVNLSVSEKELCDDLLKSAIGHWKVLKNTSPDGLRSTFLQREGHLSQNAHGYLLKIEQTGPDILFAYQPPNWTISIIKYPWMNDVLTVEWA